MSAFFVSGQPRTIYWASNPTNPRIVWSTTTEPEHQWQSPVQSVQQLNQPQDQFGPVKAAAMAVGFEWFATLVPIVLLLLITYCCVRRKKSQASQTEVATEMATSTRPETDGQDQATFTEVALEIEPEAKDFVLIVDDPETKST